MTKGRTENNRAWEKERRDRLNRSFDILAKFLPNYDDSVPYSKIEIIQKSILLIKDLQQKLKESLTENHKDILNTILELEEAFKVLIVRNKVLTALLKKCGATAPPFTEPKIFNYIVTTPLEESDLNELYVKQNGRPPKNAKARTKKQFQTLHDDEMVLQKKKKKKSEKSNEENRQNKDLVLTGKDILSDDNNITITENNGKVVDEAIKSKDGGTDIESKQLKDDSTISNQSGNHDLKVAAKISQSQSSASVVATGILLPISNLKNSMTFDSTPIIVVNAVPKSNAIMPKPSSQKKIPGKIAILPLKSITVSRKQRVRRTKKELERERKSNVKPKRQIVKTTTVENEAAMTENDTKATCDVNQGQLSITASDTPKEDHLLKTRDTVQMETEPTLPQPELSNDILASLQIPQNDSNNESMSPTAAFLMSFPVVSSGGVRIGEDEQETQDSQSPHTSHRKPANDTNILDNISNLLTTKDYERFVEDAVKNDTTTCQGNSESVKDNQNRSQSLHDRPETAISFDFQLKPITTCEDIKSVDRNNTSSMKTSVTCSATYLPEIENLSYKSSPSKKRRKSISENTFASTTSVAITRDNSQPSTAENAISTEEYIRNESTIEFMASSSSVLHTLEPPNKILKLNNSHDDVKGGQTTSMDSQFVKNSSVNTYSSNSVTTSSCYALPYNYNKTSTTVAKEDAKSTMKEEGNFDPTPFVPPFPVISMDTTVTKSSKVQCVQEKHKDRHNFLQPFAVSTTDYSRSNASVTYGSENHQFNHSFYSYPNTTSTYSSTVIPHLATSTNSSAANMKPFQDSPKTTMSMSIDKTLFKSNNSTNSIVADGFYTSLTNIGTTQSNLSQYPSSIIRPNMYTSALSLSSSSNQKPLDYAPQTPFTFSLTAPINSVSHTKNSSASTTLTSCQQSQNYLPATHSTSYAQDYNPFAFENISSISAPITPYSACRETSQFSFSLTNTTNKISSKNSSSQSSFSIDQNFLTESRPKPIAPMKSEAYSEKKSNFKNCSKVASNFPDNVKHKESVQRVEKSNTKHHVNWMTSTTDLQKNEYPMLPPLDYTQVSSLPNHYLPQASSQLSNLNGQKNTDIYFAHPIGEENFPWSPNKMIDTPNINTTTLPNLHGDLALNSITPKPQIINHDKGKASKVLLPSHMLPQQNVTSNPTNSFSVSQLVDHPKSVGQTKSYEDSVLQQKTSKTSSNQRVKTKDSKKSISNFTPNIFVESFAYNEPLKQNSSNNYSAEALISSNPSKKEHKSHSNYGNTSEYCNQLDTSSYNNMDYVTESNYNYYNNAYFPQIPDNEYFCSSSYNEQQYHNKSSRSGVPSSKHLTSIGDTAYTNHSTQNNLYAFPHPPSSGKLCQQSSQYKNSPQLSTTYNQSRSYPNTSKKQFKQDLFPSYDPNTSANYFAPSLNINSAMLPHPPLIPTPHNIPSNDDFNYTSHLNYPSVLTKNPPYSATQQMSENNQGNVMLQGNVGGTNVGNLVTNFNLSTICPEINDKSRQPNW